MQSDSFISEIFLALRKYSRANAKPAEPLRTNSRPSPPHTCREWEKWPGLASRTFWPPGHHADRTNRVFFSKILRDAPAAAAKLAQNTHLTWQRQVAPDSVRKSSRPLESSVCWGGACTFESERRAPTWGYRRRGLCRARDDVNTRAAAEWARSRHRRTPDLGSAALTCCKRVSVSGVLVRSRTADSSLPFRSTTFMWQKLPLVVIHEAPSQWRGKEGRERGCWDRCQLSTRPFAAPRPHPRAFATPAKKSPCQHSASSPLFLHFDI